MSLSRPHLLAERPPAAVVGVLLGGLLAGCGAREPVTTQTAARVNQDEITVHQIGARIGTAALAPEQVAQAEREALERLIDRQLAVQKAGDLRLDREPKVVQAIESARLDTIAKAYAERLTEGVARPTPAEVRQYYEAHPALFRERRIYQLQEFVIDADAAQLQALRAALPSLKGTDALTAHLRDGGVRFTSGAAVRAAEQLPPALLSGLGSLGDGEALLHDRPRGATLLLLQGSRLQPVDEATAAPVIEQFLLNERKRKLLDDDTQALRAEARIEYRGRFATAAAPASAPVNEAGAANADRATAAVELAASTVNKGLGLK